MIKIANIKSVLLGLLLLFPSVSGLPCSMYKITRKGKTMVGCNEDAWRTTPHIWFETAKSSGQYGAAFTGSRFDGANGFAPQSGMNEAGLVYSRLAASFPEWHPGDPNLKTITNPTQYLKDILHTCRTVDEVKAYISRYDHSFFIEDVMIYLEKSGRYLVVEPFSLTTGNDADYVLSNFCPSVTPKENAMQLDRYRKGVEFINEKSEASLEFCTAMSDAMHVCRDKIGDGTLLTSIWNAQDGKVNLYFYHRYDQTVSYDLKTELAKGDHIIALEPLFSPNAEFKQLSAFKTPLNSGILQLLLFGFGVFFFFSAWFFLVVYLRTRANIKYGYAQLALFPLGLSLFYYMYVLFRNPPVFYFPAPYKDPSNPLVTFASYLPFLLLLLAAPMILLSIKTFRENIWSRFSRWLFALNNCAYVILLFLFGYWGFFGI